MTEQRLSLNNSNQIKYIIFDVFETLIQPHVKHHPFRQLLKWAREYGRQALDGDARTVMTINGGVRAISNALGISPSDRFVESIENQIDREISHLTLFDDVTNTLNDLQSRGIHVGLCSNLAQPYGIAIEKLLSELDAKKFLSYELGTIKPEPQIYKEILSSFNCAPEECLFVGDSFEADYAGPIALGMGARQLNRYGPPDQHQISSLFEVLKYLDSDHRSA